ncbi:MAG: UbiA family prenyltransferase [Candidatus Nezhaarchaeota archaeon]|nr:UbiA family prenyltransferase [Candidatus Nezhaarchaeota archaeon]
MSKAKAYLQLVKPRVLLGMVALFVSSALASATIEGAVLDVELLSASTAVVVCLTAGANVLNNYFDRGVDSLMYRTRRRPLPSGRVSEAEALIIGALLLLLGFAAAISASLGLWVAALVSPSISLKAPSIALHGLCIAILALSSYLAAYTLWLKRRHWLAVVSASPAVASPVLAGWLVGAGRVTFNAAVYAAIAALWGLVHFWALAFVFREDYRGANIPAPPLALGATRSARMVALLAMTIALLTSLASLACRLSLAASFSLALLNAVLVWMSLSFARRPIAGRPAWRLYKFSPLYIVLALLLTALP